MIVKFRIRFQIFGQVWEPTEVFQSFLSEVDEDSKSFEDAMDSQKDPNAEAAGPTSPGGKQEKKF